MIKYSNIKFVERKGQHFDTRFTASVDETRTTGFCGGERRLGQQEE